MGEVNFSNILWVVEPWSYSWISIHLEIQEEDHAQTTQNMLLLLFLFLIWKHFWNSMLTSMMNVQIITVRPSCELISYSFFCHYKHSQGFRDFLWYKKPTIKSLSTLTWPPQKQSRHLYINAIFFITVMCHHTCFSRKKLSVSVWYFWSSTLLRIYIWTAKW